MGLDGCVGGDDIDGWLKPRAFSIAVRRMSNADVDFARRVEVVDVEGVGYWGLLS